MTRELILGALLTASFAQTVVLPSGSPSNNCESEPVDPNLVVTQTTQVEGTIQDQTGAPLTDSPVRLRKYVSARKQNESRITSTDSAGRFDLGNVKPGKYRLLASPHRGFAQPAELKCSAEKSCSLKIVLKVNPTDLPYAGCPIR